MDYYHIIHWKISYSLFIDIKIQNNFSKNEEVDNFCLNNYFNRFKNKIKFIAYNDNENYLLKIIKHKNYFSKEDVLKYFCIFYYTKKEIHFFAIKYKDIVKQDMILSLKNKENNSSEDEVNRIIIRDFLSLKNNDNNFDYLIYNDKFNFIDF